MKKFLLNVLTLVTAGVILTVSPILLQSKMESGFSYEEIAKIQPTIVVDELSLISEEAYKTTMNEMMVRLVQNKILVLDPILGFSFTSQANSSSINVIIESSGGLTKLGFDLKKQLATLKSAGVRINCHVSRAESMAFYAMVTSCDKVIAKKSVELMQHRTAYGTSGYTPSTYITDMNMASEEATKLKIKPSEWLALTRTGKDKYFTVEEIEKYKLVTEWIE